jgi:hypothetical protein
MLTQDTTTKANARGHDQTARSKQTPWGYADAIDEIGNGIYFASTPSHGGYFVPSALLGQIPEAHQARALRWSGSRNWYEEDCEWASVAVAFPDLFTPAMLEAAVNAINWRDARSQ